MAPLMVEEPCLKCHEKQGYKLGDVRGGMSVTIPTVDIHNRQNAFNLLLMASYGFIWLLGIGVIFYSHNLAVKE